MAVQMLRQWNGLEAYSVQTLSPAEEARLVAAGLAVQFTAKASEQGAPRADSGRLLAFGDSLTLGAQLSSTANRYARLIADGRGWVETNAAVSGTVVGRWMEGQIAGRVVNAGDQIVMLAGYNDARFGGTTANNLTQYATNLTGALCHLGVPDSSKVYSQVGAEALNSAQITYSGTWITSSTWLGGGAQSRCGAYSTATASFAETVVEGDVVHVGIGGIFGGGPNSCSVMVDGFEPAAGRFSATPLLALPDSGGELWQPYVIRITGLSAGRHIVRVTNRANQNLLLSHIAGYNSASLAKPVLHVAGPIRMTATGYAVAPANATDAVMRSYQQVTQGVCRALAGEGLLVRYVDLDSTWFPAAVALSADSVHPLEAAHYQWAQQFLRSINSPL